MMLNKHSEHTSTSSTNKHFKLPVAKVL